MKVSLLNNGICYRRQLEQELVRFWAISNGFDITRDYGDLVFFFTCAYDKVHYDTAVRDLGLMPKNRTIIMGCLPSIDPAKCDKYYASIPLEYFKSAMRDLDRLYNTKYKFDTILPSKVSPNIMICRGCLNNCNYCKILKASKSLVSYPFDYVVKQVRYQWKVGNIPLLMGEDTGAYGQDFGSSIAELLFKLAPGKGVYIDNMDPYWFTKYYDVFDDLISSGFIKRMCLGVQSFSNRLLEAMGRRYNYDLMQLAHRIKKHGSIMDIHYLVGHPAETKQDFKATIKGLKITDPQNTAYSVFECWMNDEVLPVARERRALLYSLGRPYNWACPNCGYKKWECICEKDNNVPNDPINWMPETCTT